MATSLRKQFQEAQKRFKKDLLIKLEVAAHIVADELVTGATVDTGLHAANFKPSINKSLKTYYKFDYFGIDESKLKYPNGRMIPLEAARALANDFPTFLVGHEVVWTNNVPYVDDIDALTTSMDSLDSAKFKIQAEMKKK